MCPAEMLPREPEHEKATEDTEQIDRVLTTEQHDDARDDGRRAR